MICTRKTCLEASPKGRFFLRYRVSGAIITEVKFRKLENASEGGPLHIGDAVHVIYKL